MTLSTVARIADFIRKHLVGKTLSQVKAVHDENVFGKVGTSAAELEKLLPGKKIAGAGTQGKYFWCVEAEQRSFTYSMPTYSPHP